MKHVRFCKYVDGANGLRCPAYGSELGGIPMLSEAHIDHNGPCHNRGYVKGEGTCDMLTFLDYVAPIMKSAGMKFPPENSL